MTWVWQALFSQGVSRIWCHVWPLISTQHVAAKLKASLPLWSSLSLCCCHSGRNMSVSASVFSAISLTTEWNPKPQQGKVPSSPLRSSPATSPWVRVTLNYCRSQYAELICSTASCLLLRNSYISFKNQLKCFHLGGVFHKLLPPTRQDWPPLSPPILLGTYLNYYSFKIYELVDITISCMKLGVFERRDHILFLFLSSVLGHVSGVY